jgi:hypothetical protein
MIPVAFPSHGVSVFVVWSYKNLSSVHEQLISFLLMCRGRIGRIENPLQNCYSRLLL